MRRIVLALIVLLTSSVLLAPSSLAEHHEGEKPAAAASKAPPAEAKSNSTEHSVRIGGKTIQYTATAGWLILKDNEGNPTARFGYTSYVRNGVEGKAKRPLMFAFNGGPGSSSIWLHMGILGPRRAVVKDTGFAPPPPAQYVDNAYSVLDVTDIVMVDPVGTGFSKPLGKATGEDFWGVDQDIRSVGQFVKQYVTQNERWSSPKYILGESYGGIRSAGLVWHMQNTHSMNFNGVIVVSPFLSMTSGMDGANIDTPHVLYLSTLASTAWYHDLIPNKPTDLAAFVDRVERFAYDTYAPALMKGYTISDSEKRSVAKKLGEFTGTSTDYWMRADLRVSHGQFLQELQRDKRIITGRIDSRFTGPAVNPLGETMDYDPFFPAVGPAFTAAFMSYLHEELEFGKDENYVVSGFGIGGDWDWTHQPPGGGGIFAMPWADLRQDLASALRANPGLHLLVQQGYYDLATPLGATRYDIDHLNVPADARERIAIDYYEAGHMMYLHEPSMKKYRDDLVRFIQESDRL